MTQETKLGLVIGGAFILCFSLILSHAEDGHAVEAEIDALALTSQAPDGFGEQAGGGRISLEEFLAPGRSLERLREAEQRLAASKTPDGPSTDVDSLNLPSGQKADAPASSTAESDTRQSPLPPPPPRSQVADAILNRPRRAHQPASEPIAPAAAAQHVPADVKAVGQTLAGKPEPTAASAITDAAARTNRKESRPRDVELYVVARGDNLTRIARKCYGAASKRNVQRIFEANRRVLKDINSLRTGQQLRIPGVNKSRASGRKQVRWYRVQPKDRYSKIAKVELGSEARWKEIFELNTDIFPNPDRIRPGTSIRLPAE